MFSCKQEQTSGSNITKKMLWWNYFCSNYTDYYKNNCSRDLFCNNFGQDGIHFLCLYPFFPPLSHVFHFRAFGKGVPGKAFHVEVPWGVLQVQRDVPGNMGLVPFANSFRHTPFLNAQSVRKKAFQIGHFMSKFLVVFLFCSGGKKAVSLSLSLSLSLCLGLSLSLSPLSQSLSLSLSLLFSLSSLFFPSLSIYIYIVFFVFSSLCLSLYISLLLRFLASLVHQCSQKLIFKAACESFIYAFIFRLSSSAC